jgi:hypothetical protein
MNKILPRIGGAIDMQSWETKTVYSLMLPSIKGRIALCKMSH